MGEVAEVVGLGAEQIGCEGSLEHSVGEDAGKEVGEDGDDVELHRFSFKNKEMRAQKHAKKHTKNTSKRAKIRDISHPRVHIRRQNLPAKARLST